MRAELHHVRGLLADQHRADREAAAQRLGQRHHVGRDAVGVRGEQMTGAAHAALDFVEHQQRAMAIAQRAQAVQELLRRRRHAAFALHGLDQHRADVTGSHRRFGRGQIVEIAVAEARRQRFVAFVVLGLRGGGDGGQRAAVEAAAEAEDHAAIGRTALRGRVLAHQFDRGLVGLGAGIAEEHALARIARR